MIRGLVESYIIVTDIISSRQSLTEVNMTVSSPDQCKNRTSVKIRTYSGCIDKETGVIRNFQTKVQYVGKETRVIRE